jgi:hypothetical protein
MTVNALLPANVRGDLRSDAGQDLAVAILSGAVDLKTLLTEPSAVRRFVSAARRKNYEANGYAVSLDQPRRDGGSWHDVLHSS